MRRFTLILVWCTLVTLNSCKDDEVIIAQSPGLADFKGLKVPIPEGVPSEVFSYMETDFQRFFYSQFKNVRSSADFQITLDEFIKYSKPIVDKYPNRTNLSKDDAMVKKIQKDFKHLSEKEIAEQLTKILDYYNQIVVYELMKVLPKVPNNFKGGKLASGYFGTSLNSCEFWLIAQNSGKQDAVKWATETALSWADQDFAGTTSQGKGDAFRHSVWNALMIQKLSDQGYSTNEAIVFTRGFTEAHECNTTDDFDKNMDLHNNAMGATTYPSLTSYSYRWTGCGFLCWGRIAIFNNPGYDNIRQYYRSATNNSVQVYSTSDIQNTSVNILVRIL